MICQLVFEWPNSKSSRPSKWYRSWNNQLEFPIGIWMTLAHLAGIVKKNLPRIIWFDLPIKWPIYLEIICLRFQLVFEWPDGNSSSCNKQFLSWNNNFEFSVGIWMTIVNLAIPASNLSLGRYIVLLLNISLNFQLVIEWYGSNSSRCSKQILP